MLLTPTDRWADDRVALFALTPDRVTDDYVRWLADPEINRYLESRFAPQPRDAVEAFVATMAGSAKDVMWGMHDKALDRHVGNIKLGPIDARHGTGEIGLMIGDRAAWGRGIGSAAIERVCDIARHELGLRKITAGCYACNVGSRKAFEKVGFSVEGVRPAQYLLEGRAEDLVLLGRLLF